ERAEADARRHGVEAARFDLGADALGERERAINAAARQEAAELVAAVAEARVDLLADRAEDDAADEAQDLVARLVAVRVVVLLEPVEVEEDERQRVPEARGALLLDLEAREEVRLVEEARELVRHREPAQLALEPLSLRD